ncbi:protein of unknown function (plasmid) [Rhodovastum atsumiense]|nr:protein of unknown function [Rhodovastum atsumiense]
MNNRRTSSIGMPRRADMGHALAAETHEHAARAHRLAAESCVRGNHAAALEFAGQAVQQAHNADLLSRNAHNSTRETPASTR